MKIITVQRTEFLTTVPKFSRDDLKKTVYRMITNEQDVWCLRMLLHQLPYIRDTFQISFRKPVEYGLEKRFFTRVCDFSSALDGETIDLWSVVALYVHLSRQGVLEFSGEVMAQFEHVGRYYFRLGIYISDGIPYLVSEYDRGVSFDPEKYYGVLVK